MPKKAKNPTAPTPSVPMGASVRSHYAAGSTSSCRVTIIPPEPIIPCIIAGTGLVHEISDLSGVCADGFREGGIIGDPSAMTRVGAMVSWRR